YRAVFTDACGSTNSAAATLSLNSAPSINQQPANQAVCSGSSASFTSTATGVPAPTVQWQISTNGGATFNDIPGATSTTYSFATVNGDDGHQFRAVFSNSCASGITSNAATLHVDTLPVVNTDPLSQTICAGATASFTAAA